MQLPFETDYAPGASRQLKKWLAALDDLGTENVRIRLIQGSTGPDDAFYRAGSDVAVPRGFAEDWLRYRDRRARAVEQRWRWAIFIPACISALGASAAGLVTLAPHLSRVVRHLRAATPSPAPPASLAAAPAPSVAATASLLTPAPAAATAWQPVAVDEYIVVNGNVFQAEAGPKPEAIQRIESPDVIRFQIVAGNKWYNDGSDAERTELDGYKQPFEPGVPYWVAYSVYIEPGPRLTSDWIALGQIPGVMGHILKNTIMTWSLANKSLHSERVIPGQSYQFVERFIFDPVNGYYGSWFNGRQVVDYHGRVGDAGKKPYYKFGIYRGMAPETMAVRYANFKFGTTDLSGLVANPDPIPPLLPWP